MAYIYQLNNRDQVGEKRLQLGNEEWLRPLNISAGGFLGIKVGVRFAMSGIGKVMDAGFRIGWLAGADRPLRHPSGPVEYLGMSVFLPNSTAAQGPETGQPVYVASTTPYYSSFDPRLFSVIGSSSTILTSPTVAVYGGVTYPSSAPQMFAFEIIKTNTSPPTGFTTWTLNMQSVTAAPPAFCSHANFLANMEIVHGATFQAGVTSVQTTALAHSGPGLFDTLSISWNKSCPIMDIFDVAVLRTY